MTHNSLVEVKDLSVSLGRGADPKALVKNVSFSLGREKLAIVGESGAGKSTVGRALMGLLPPVMSVTASTLRFDTIDLRAVTERQMRGLRGRRMAMIMQDPKYSLNPVMTAGEQIAETWLLHAGGNSRKKEAREKTLAMLDAVKIRHPERVFQLYPHEISGGMGQRVMIAMMLISDPELLIADEPTSALDVTVKTEILALLDELIDRRGMGTIFVTHDLNLVRNFCDRVLVMYSGRVVETLAASELDHAEHPYTRALLSSLPTIRAPVERLSVMTRDPSWLTEESVIP